MFFDAARLTLRLGLLAILLPVLAACPPPPQPFAHGGAVREEERVLLAMPDSQGILVREAEGVEPELAARIAEAMADALAAANVPASTTDSNSGSYFLVSRIAASPIDANETRLLILWELLDHDGGLVGRHLQHETVTQRAWSQGRNSVVHQITEGAAAQVAAFIQDEASGAEAVADVRPIVAIMPVEGAPGDGDQQLPRAIRYFLERAGYEVTDDLSEARAVILGTVQTSPPRAGAQKVDMTWSVMTPEGAEVGVVNLDNTVPAGALDGRWGETAYAAAGGAAEGIAAI
ncbi:MAG: hypothetical protein O3A96_16540, partial [Proteobacteria bacterium]|nr:hypothetical protein [Pseudomonadota bacterium]